MNIVCRILSLLFVAATAVMVIWRTLYNGGVKVKKPFALEGIEQGEIPTKEECAKVFFSSLLFRIFVFVAGVGIYYLFLDMDSHNIVFGDVLKIWERWDSTNYIRIADGYSSFETEGEYLTLVFFPLYSFLLNIVNYIIPSAIVSGLIVSTLCYSGACVYFYKLMCLDFSKETAVKAVVLMTLIPFGFFFGGVMSEGVFLFTSIASLYYIRKHNWFAAGAFGFFAALSRSVGVFIIFPATVEFIEEYRLFENLRDIKPKIMLVLKKWLWLILIPLGTCVYLYVNYTLTGDPLKFLVYQSENWNQMTQPFFKTAGSMWDLAFGDGYRLHVRMSTFIPGFIMLFGMYILMNYGAIKHRTMYSMWFLVYLIVNTSMSWPMSLPRYLSCAVPAYVILGELCGKHKKLYHALVIVFAVLFGVYLAAYLKSSQIM